MTDTTKLRAEMELVLLRFEQEADKLRKAQEEFDEACEHPWAEHWINAAKQKLIVKDQKTLAFNKKLTEIEDVVDYIHKNYSYD